MVFKRYIKKGGRVYGPYYYESYRDKNGEVRKRYVGTKPLKSGVNTSKKYSLLFLLAVVFAIVFLVILKTDIAISGKVISGVTQTPFSLGGFSKLSGYVVSEIAEEDIVEEFEVREKNAKLKIKKPKEVLGNKISKNKNHRMEYERIGYEVNEGLILYFDMLNYTEYIDESALVIRKENEKSKGKNESINESEELKESNFTIPINETLINDTITNETESNESENSINNETIIENPEIGDKNETDKEGDKLKEDEEKLDDNKGKEEDINKETDESKKGNKITGIFGGFLGIVGRVIENVNDESSDKNISLDKEKGVDEDKDNKEDKKENKKEIDKKNESEENDEKDKDNESKEGVTDKENIDNKEKEQKRNEDEKEKDNKEKIKGLTLEEIKKGLENLSEESLKGIEDKALIVLNDSEFNITVNESEARRYNADFKWGYKVGLKDKQLMAKIEVTSEELISIYDNHTLRVGRSLLSFKDLVNSGYNVRFERPSLDMGIYDKKIVNETINETLINETIVNETLENVTIINKTLVNETIINETLINKTVNESLENVTSVNETIINETFINETFANKTIINETEEEKEIGKEKKEEKKEEKEEKKNETIIETIINQTIIEEDKQIDKRNETKEIGEEIKKDIENKTEEKEEVKEGECYDNITRIFTDKGWRYFKDLEEDDKVMTLNQETGEQEWQLPYEKQDFEGDKEMYSIKTIDSNGREGELIVSEKHKVYVNLEGIDSIVNPSSYNVIKLPSKSSGFISFNNLEKADFDNSNLSWDILNQTTENIFSFGKCSESAKSSSLVINALCSDFEKEANLPLASPLGFETVSTPCSLINFSSLLSTFSSDRNLIERDAELDIVSTSHQTGCIMQGCFNMIFVDRGECFKNLFNGYSCFEHFQNLPDHNPCTFESRLATTNLRVCNKVLINFNSHCNNKNSKELYKLFSLQLITEVYTDYRNRKDIYFLDDKNNPIKILEIEKVPYDGRMYDVDVENDVVLVERNGFVVWSGNSDLKKEEKAEPVEEKKEEIKEEKDKKQEEKSEETASSSEEPDEPVITGNVVRFFGLIGRAITGFVIANEVEDVYYNNTITVYIERDFSNENVSVGETIYLDPTLIIEITKAEHLDENRSFIRDIYDYVKAKDDNWTTIPQSQFVRVTFQKNLTKSNDITIYARYANYSNNISNNSDNTNESNNTGNETSNTSNEININNKGGEIIVYRFNDTEEIARFTNITKEDWYKIYLTNLNENESYNVFDLQIIGDIVIGENNSGNESGNLTGNQTGNETGNGTANVTAAGI